MNRDARGTGMTSQRARDRLIQRLRESGVADERVLRVMGVVPRHLFVSEALDSRAYEDTALPIGHGQTISQPYVVARMTELLLRGGRPGKVLEIGTGCGYQTAVLAPLVEQLFSIERMRVLHEQAADLLPRFNFQNVNLRHGDGFAGWPRHAPFDGILAAAAPDEVPRALTDQLAVGGRLVMPVGGGRLQSLVVVDRTVAGLQRREIEKVNFVPLLGGLA